jgi:hypothetical protein
MLHLIRTASGRVAAAIATAALLAGAAPMPAASVALDSRVKAASMQTHYYYHADGTYSEVVGYATSGCGDPYTLHFGYTTFYLSTMQTYCPG